MCYWCVILAPSAPRRPHLCCWRCRSRSPELRLKSWLCWTPARRKGWAAGSEPRARAALVLREQIKTTFILQVHHISQRFLERRAWLTVIVAEVLIPAAVSGQRPRFSFIALAKLHYTVLIQLYPGPLWVDHLIHKRHSLSVLSHTEHLSLSLSQTHTLSHQSSEKTVIAIDLSPSTLLLHRHKLGYGGSLTCKHSIHLIDTYKNPQE